MNFPSLFSIMAWTLMYGRRSWWALHLYHQLASPILFSLRYYAYFLLLFSTKAACLGGMVLGRERAALRTRHFGLAGWTWRGGMV